MKRNSFYVLFMVISATAFCQADEPIPFATFSEITINTTLPQYRALTSDGGFVEVEGGVRGLIVYRENSTTYRAYERNCTYRPTEACAQIEVDISRIFFIDRCCGSNFSLSDGYPTKGPASWSLRRYHVEINGSTLLVTDEIDN